MNIKEEIKKSVLTYRGVETSCNAANISANSLFSLLVVASSSVLALNFECQLRG